MSQKFLLALNIISLVAITGIIAVLSNLSNEIKTINDMVSGQVLSGNQVSALAPAATPALPEEKERETANFAIEISDQGYSPAEIKISDDKITTIKTTNKGEKDHSLVIDGLNIDSGSISSGQSIELVIYQTFEKSENYTFYSNAEGDDPQTFTGVLMVLK